MLLSARPFPPATEIYDQHSAEIRRRSPLAPPLIASGLHHRQRQRHRHRHVSDHPDRVLGSLRRFLHACERQLLCRLMTSSTRRAMEQLALKRSRLLALQQLLKELDNSYETIQKRTCLMNGGMSHSCDYSEMSPGR
ncbi:PREDICTED: uncharacterized protein LOC106818756 [Priapulus caudatus]|uniref:Uncharacterized protein LOC106818756 n=1 Tax=Priapulus caudatus TaxID=37621 RepID=A0ABM1F393_PRICU|nr:PREDICTED: uncharacterized protein LOC106818756 [Priapulus caudatus]